MPEPLNVQVFQGVAARILDRLYNEFPNPITLDVSHYGLETATDLDLGEEETFGALSTTSSNTMIFLAKEDFVSIAKGYSTLDGNSTEFFNCVLTQKGLATLGAVPSSIDGTIERRPIAQQLRDALNGGARDTVSETVKTVFTHAMKLGAMAVGAV